MLDFYADQLILKELCPLETLIKWKIVSLALWCAQFLSDFYEKLYPRFVSAMSFMSLKIRADQLFLRVYPLEILIIWKTGLSALSCVQLLPKFYETNIIGLY